MFSPEESLQRVIQKYTTPIRHFQVIAADGHLLAESPGWTGQTSLQIIPTNMPTLFRESDKALVACNQSVALKNQTGAHVLTITDATHSYKIYQSFLKTLLLSGSGAVLLAMSTGLILIRRSLQPLHKISNVAAAVSVEHLQDVRLMLENPPTEVQQLADALSDMLNRLSQSWDQEQQLLSNISHELRTPLTVVQGYLESTLRRGQNLTEMQMEGLTISLEETQRVVRLLKDLLDLARAEAGSVHLQIEPIDLAEFAEEISAIAAQLGPNPISTALPQHPVWVKADRDRLKQVMLNLLTNAIRYSDVAAPITLKLKTTADSALLQVEDRGVGISAEHLPHIFDRFYCVSASRSRKEGGIGLGLAITKALVEQMRGKIWVESQPQVGSTFTICLPLTSAST
jgi:hypothetical protein